VVAPDAVLDEQPVLEAPVNHPVVVSELRREGLLGFLVFHELDACEDAHAAYVSDGRVVVERLEPVVEVLAQLGGSLDEPVLHDVVHDGGAGRAGDGVAAVGVAVGEGLAEGVVHPVACYGGAEGHVAAREALGGGDYVGDRVPVV